MIPINPEDKVHLQPRNSGLTADGVELTKPTKFRVIRNLLQNEFGQGKIEHLGKGFYHIELSAITCTGGDVTQHFMIPFKHKLHQFIVKHTDSSDVDSTDALTYTLKYGLGQIKPNLLLTLKSISTTAVVDAIHLFTDFWRGQTRYQLITNTTNTDLLYISFIVEIEDMPNKGD